MKRLPSIDIARGLVMVIMALDHTRDYLHIHAAQNPTDLTTTTPILFFTRWITHLCAPSFVFLSGASAWLYLYNTPQTTTAKAAEAANTAEAAKIAAGADTLRQKRRFLWQRGLVLILVEFTLVNFAMTFDTHFRVFLFEVIATIGSGQILLSLVSRLKPGLILAIAILLFAGHNIVDYVSMPKSPVLGFIGSLFLVRGALPLGGSLLVFAYPVLPWFSIMLLGFCAGRIFTWPVETQKKLLLRSGVVALALFVVLRFVNVYGDPQHWSTQKNGVYTFISFMNITKYPPSLLFGLATLGILLIVLSITAGKKAATAENALSRILLVYGRVPLFYFVIHLYLIHLIMLVMVACQGYSWAQMDFGVFKFGRPATAGLSLGAVYAIWAAVVIALYPACRWYGRYKAKHREKTWLRFL